MNKQTKYSILIILGLTLFIGLVKAQPTPIGTTLQHSPFESNPTAYSIIGFTATQVPTATAPNMFDGNYPTAENVRLFTTLTSTPLTAQLNLTTFTTPGVIPFTPGWVEINIRYEYPTAAGSQPDSYRIEYTVGTTNPWITLQPDVSGTASVFTISAQTAARPWSQAADPTGGAWTWSDIASLKIRFFFTKGTNAWDGTFFNIYEVWVTVHELPLPPTSSTTFSVQPKIVWGVDSTSGIPAIFAEIYVEQVTDMFSYEWNLTVDGTVLTPLEGDTYWPWTSALGGSPLIDPSATPSWIYMAFSMPPPVPVGSAFTGNSPVARVYFLVNVPNSSSAIHFKPGSVILGDSTGTQITATVYDGLYQFGPPSVPEFPLGIGIIMALAPLIPILYIWRLRKNKPKLLTTQTNPKGLKP